MSQKRRRRTLTSVLLGAFFLFSSFFPTLVSAKVEQWDFQKPEDYQFDSQKIEVADGAARLKASTPFQDSSRENFEKGNFELNTWAGRGMVELIPPTFQEISGADLAVPSAIDGAKLVALWNFDEPSGTNLLDAASRTVAKSSDAEIISSQTGFGYARSFDGEKTHVFVPHYQTFNFEKSFTFEAWIRPTFPARAKPQTIISRWQTIAAQKSFALQLSTEGKLDLLISPDGVMTMHHAGDTVLAGGSWYHVAATFDGQVLQIYLNGVPEGMPMSFPQGIHAGSNPIYLGALVQNKLEEFYQGAMDQVAFYTRALTETEIRTHAGNARGLVGLWHLNERGGPLADASGYGLNAVSYENPQYEVEGKAGTALHFDGDSQYIETPASMRFAADGTLTLSAWIKPDRIPGMGQMATIVSSVSEPSSAIQSGEYSLSLTGPDGTLRAFASGANPAEAVGKIPLMPNLWQHVAVTWAAGRVNLYVNGVLDSSSLYTGKISAGKSALRLAMDSKKNSKYAGALDEVALYRRAHTEQEIAQLAGAVPQGGFYVSALKDAGSDSMWRRISWKEPLPYGKELQADETGLLHLYHLNEKDQLAFVDSKGEIAANPLGTYAVGGIFSQARWFASKGNDKIISQKNFPSLSTFTASLWFQFASSQAGLSDRLFSIGDTNPTAYRGADGRIHVSMLGAREIIGQRVIRDTRWHHLAVTADGRDLFLYIDGVLDGNSPFITATAEAPLVLGNLKSTDTFQGAIDEFAFYNYPLSRETVYQHFLRGQMALRFQVRTSNDPTFSGTPWRDLNGNKQIRPDAGAYTAGLWHFEEKNFQGRPDEVTDAGRYALHGRAYGHPSTQPAAVSGSGISLNGSSDYIEVPDADGLHVREFTLSAWIKPNQIQEQDAVILDKLYEKGSPSFSSYALELLPGNRLNVRAGHAGGYVQVHSDTDGEIAAGRWNHVAATSNGKEIRLYINGSLKKVKPFSEPVIYDAGPLFLGRYGAADSRFFDGQMDEVSIEAHAFSEEEIAHLYENLVPRETTAPEASLSLERGRYFQYRAAFETKAAAASPLLQSVEIQANAFSADRPWISNSKGVSYADISHFSEKTGAGHRGAVSYQLSNDGANWYYHNGRRWVIASGSTESNTAAQIQERIHDFAKDLSIGSFFFKAFLHSPTGVEPAELDSVEVEYMPNKLTMISPNGGEAWLAGTKQVISWNSTGEVQKVRIEYSKDDFKKDFHSIVKDISNTGNYTWEVPDDANTQVKVRVMDSLEPRVRDTSDLSFRIVGDLEVLTPNWNERWEVGSTQEITWKTTGKIPEVRIDFSTDDFVSTVYPIVDSVKNEGKYAWKVADPISRNVKVRVADVRDPLVSDKSNDVFTIHGKIEMLSPAPGSRWIVGSEQQVRWKTTGAVAGVKVEYQTSKNPEWITISEKLLNEKQTLTWKVPDEVDSTVKIRVTDLSDPKTFVESAPLAIVGGLRLVNPKGGENWTVGSRRKIAWQTVGTVPLVNLEYKLSAQEEWLPIAKQIANTGEYVWDIPNQPADLVAVRVTDVQDPQVMADSVTPVRVIPAFNLKSPNGGENFRIDFESDIVWETQGKSDKVKIEYSKDGFKSDVHTIIAEASNIGRFSWKVADDASLNARVRVSDVAIPSAHDISDSDFRIHGGFKINMPKGGEKLEVGSIATLTWDTIGTIPEVRLEYSHDDFAKDVRTIASAVPNKGRLSWTVPDDIGSGFSLRVADTRDLQTQAYSEGAFSIIGDFRLIEPAGGENVIAGTVLPIKWKGAGSVPFLQIDYSEDGFEKSFKNIAEQAPNTGVYQWTVPNLVGHEFRIRIWDPSQPDAQDVMTKSAKIVSGFRLTEPNGGEVFYVGDEVTVKWETYGSAPTVKLEFSDDQFNRNIGEVADAYENLGFYKWRVPDMPTGSYRMRIADPRDKAAFDISNSDFKVRSRFIVLSPNGGEGWAVGEKKMITWQTTGSVPAVNLEYSIDNFASVKNIAEKVPNTGSYEWTVPDNVAQDVKVRISDLKDFEAMDVSDGAFRIEGVLTLREPAGGEVWKAGEQRVIKWDTTGRIEGVRLDYSRDNFASEIKTIAETLPNTGTYNWTVPDDLSPNTKVRVTDLKNPRVQSLSRNVFEIAASFLMMAPNGGEKWHAAEKREITWATVGTVREVNLEYSTDNFKTEPQTIDRGVLNSGRFTWELPRELGDSFKVRVCDADSPKVCDVSDTPFGIESPFEITYPKGGERWTVGSDQEIRWNAYGYIPRVFIQYAVGEKPVEWKTLIDELPNEGHFLFRVPDDISTKVHFRISDYEDSSLYSETQEPVEFIGTFQMLTPNGGEKWLAGTTRKITWNTIGTAPEVRLEYSTDDFQRDIKLIEAKYKNTGSYDWKVPAEMAAAVKVRVQDASNAASFDISDNPFKILPHFTLTTPNGGERWKVGDKVRIEWKKEGVVPRVRLEYGVRQEGKDTYAWQPIAEVRGTSDIYDWEVPETVSSDVKIRIYDERDAETTEESDEPFKILARFKPSTPKADEVLQIDSRHQIKWETYGRVPSVKLEYALVAEAGEEPIFKTIENLWANSGSYYWTVPDDASEKMVLRISDAREPEAFGISDFFRVRGSLKLELPEGGLFWPVGSQQTINWETVGTISNVKLEYSTDGKVWKLIEESLPNSGKYGWLVPDDLSQTVRLRVSNVQNAAVMSESDKLISIIGEFAFTSPEAGQKWAVASTQKITWSTTGSVKRIRLDYAAGTDAWKSVSEEPLNNEGSFEWTVPDLISSAVRLRLRDADNAAAMAVSDPFEILGVLEILSPVGGEVWEVARSKKITWKTTGTIPSVRIEGLLEEDGAVQNPWFLIAEKADNTGSFDWSLPDKISDKLKIRISDVRDAKVVSASPEYFSIIGSLQIQNPKGGEKWTVGTSQQIVWASQGTVPNVLLEFSNNDFYRDVNLIASGVPNTGAALWTVPDAISPDVQVRVSDFRDKRAFALSKSFGIQGKLGLVTPAEGSVLKVASKTILHWESTGTIPQVRLEYSRDNFQRDIQVIENVLENKNDYEWTVPDIVSTTVQLRVTDVRDTAVNAISSVFKVEGTLALKFPVGGEKFQVLSTQRVLWDTVGSIPKVRLEYSKDEFAQDIHVIASEVPNQGVYEWIVPDDIASGIKLRVLNASNFSVSSTNASAFEIHGALMFTTATAGQRWVAGSKQNLSWQSIGTIPQVKLEYSKDDFQKDIQLISESETNENRYEWTVPDDISDNVRLRIQDVRSGEVFAVTTQPLSIIGALKMTAPAAARVLRVGEQAALKWEATGTIPGVRLEYQTEGMGATDWKLISGLAENTGEYLWEVPNDISSKVRVRVSDPRDTAVENVSSEFIIAGKVRILSPAGGERWIVETKHDLIWETTGNIQEVTLQFSTDQFAKDIRVIAEKIPNSGRFLWAVPDAISSTLQTRVFDTRMPELVTSTSLPFAVVGDFVISAPSAPVVWKVGSEVSLEWQTIGSIPKVKLEYVGKAAARSGEFLSALATGLPASAPAVAPDTRMIQDQVPNQGRYTFRVPDWIGQNGSIRISDSRDPQVAQVSPSIKIEGAFQFIVPRQGEIWKTGEEKLLEWKTTGTIKNVALDYSTDHFQRMVQPVELFKANENRVLWVVPDVYGPVQVRVRDAADASVYAISEEVQVRGTLQVVRPSGNEPLSVGSRREITWKSLGSVPQVRLEYSDDGFKEQIYPIESKLETSRLASKDGLTTYEWQVPDLVSSRVQVRVSDVRDASISAVSDPFKIQGGFEVVTPRGGEIWTVGSQHEISWKTTGSIPLVRIEYSRDGFHRDIQRIDAAVTNQGTYSWTVSDAISSRLWIRVVDERDAQVWAAHNEPIEIQGAVELAQPRSGEIWTAGQDAKIEWKTTGGVSEIRIEYVPVIQENREDAAPQIIADRVPNQGSYVWRIPDQVPPHVQIRVSDSANARVFSQTPTPVKILGTLKMMSPNAEMVWPIGSTQQIVWESRGYIPQVKIEYSRDGFKNEIGTLYPLLPNTGAVKWKVTDLIGKNFQIRISDVQNPGVYAVTAFPIEIAGHFYLTAPLPGAVLEVGDKTEIYWQTVGTIPEVRLEYSATEHFSDAKLIADRVMNVGHYRWEVPDTIGGAFWMRVSESQNPEVQAVSEAPFQIQGRLLLTAPQGGEIWKVGDEVGIAWDSVGSITNVTLEYSTDDFETASPIAENIANKGRYAWRIPDIVSDKVKIRVRDAKNGAVYSVSQMPLKVQGSFVLMSPQAGEFWESGTQHSIIWQTIGSIPFVTLEYSTDHFATVMPVILGAANEGRYQWTVPDISSETLKIRLVAAHDQSIRAVSETIEIGGNLTIEVPNGGETWAVGEDAEIQWRTQGTIPRVRLEISRDNFTNDIKILETSLENQGRYTWKVPDQIASGYRLRVTDAKNSRITDLSNAPFKIMGRMEFTAPKAGEIWPVGSTQALEWRTSGNVPTVHLEYSKDQFVTALPLAMKIQNSGRYSWEVPDLAGESIQFRVSDANDPNVAAATLHPVMIQSSIQLTAPQGGEVWKALESHPITWRTVGTMENVNLDYSINDFEETQSIASSLANTGSYLWTVPDLSTRNLKVRVSDSLNPNVSSENRMPIQVSGGLKLISPAGGEVWLVDTEHPIQWMSVGKIGFVRLEYSTDGFRTIFPIGMKVPNTGIFMWTVPDAISKTANVRVISEEDDSVLAESESPFEIRGALNLLTPTSGEDWTVGSRAAISWQTTGTISHVRLEFSTDDFASDVQVIAPNLDNKGIYYWDIPVISVPALKIRVADVNHPDVYDISKNDVRLTGSLELTYPGGGEIFEVGERTEIRWRSTPNIANVKLEYSTDNFETSTLISDYTPNNGKFTWNLPDVIADEMRVKVSDATNASIFSFSRFPFRTRGNFRMITPKGGESWVAGSRQTLTWTTIGRVPKVRLEYSSDNFETSLPIAAGIENTGSYVWTVPEVPYPEIKIRVIAADAPSVQATTEGGIRITGRIELVSPSGNERWIVGEQRVVRWQTLGYIPTVDLEYSKDGFAKDIHAIVSKAPNVGSYTWQIPNDAAKEVKLRIRSSEDRKVEDVSTVPFMIDFYRVRWTVRDNENKDHLSGLVMTDSSGKTVSRVSSPAEQEYPYGIYTTVWSKAGYADSRSTWLADRDRTFEVLLEPKKETTELVRSSFQYDKVKDLMRIMTWFERNGKSVPAVIEAEVKIFKGETPIKTLHSSAPDNLGYFHMLWDTSTLEGDAKYLASVAITTATSEVKTSPMSFQLDLPVKERKEPVVRHAVSSVHLKPMSGTTLKAFLPEDKTPEPVADEIPSAGAQEKTAPASREPLQKAVPAPVKTSAPAGSSLNVPQTAVLHETIAVTYVSGPDVRPVLDLYDANKRLVIRGERMRETENPGTYVYLIPVQGISFIPGKSVRVSVIESATGRFKSADILISSASSALGYDKEMGGTTVLNILAQLDELHRKVRQIESGRQDFTVLESLETSLSRLAGLLTEQFLDPKVLKKLNEIASDLALIAEKKGYNAGFLIARPLGVQSDLSEVGGKLRSFYEVIESLQSLYRYSSGVPSSAG